MEFLPVVCLCLLSCSGTTSAVGNEPVKEVVVVVTEDSEAILPCSLSDKRNLEDVVFEWKRDDQKEVFLYDAGVTYNDGLPGQDEQFRGRVSHLEDELKNGVASIKIQNTRPTDSGDYTCIFPNFQPRQTFHIKLVVGPVVVNVPEDSDVILPCSLSTDITAETFDWKKNGQDVFLYTSGHEHMGPEFTGRVSHFPDELKNGNASITIRKTKVADSGDYTCDFPRLQPRQTFHIRLVVGAAQPDIDVLAAKKDRWLLQCKAHGVAPLTVEWQDSANNKLQAEKPETSERGGQLYITVKITVTKTDNYTCVATQKNISHQIVATIPVFIQEPVKEVVVDEDSEAILPCSLSDKQNIENVVFDWKKDGQKEVFFYDAGVTYNDGRHGQDEQFKGRVSHFEDELKNGNASIKIQNTRLTDSGDYTCIFPHFQPRQIFNIKLVVGPVKVPEDSDVILPCSLSTDITAMVFDWKKDGQDVFLYNTGSPEGQPGPQFTGRVSHFTDELKNGVASIIIRNTKVADSGDYICDFPRRQPRQIFHIRLVVGAAPKPHVKTLHQTKDQAVLQCEVHCAFPEPEVVWKDSSGNIITSEALQVKPRGDCYDIILITTVTKTGRYYCVVRQKEISHQTESDTYMHFEGPTTSESGNNTGSILGAFSGGLLVAAAGFGLRWLNKRRILKQNSPSPPPGMSEMENLNST